MFPPVQNPPPFLPPLSTAPGGGGGGSSVPAPIVAPNPSNRADPALYYKTRLCPRFSSGSCIYGDGCTYAHGHHELRRPICKKFNNERFCPYGARCTFAHPEPKANRPETVRIHGSVRESNGTDQKPPYWKSRICSEWEMMGDFSLGKACNYAHGFAELRKCGDQKGIDTMNGIAVPSNPLPNPTKDVPDLMNRVAVPSSAPPNSAEDVASRETESANKHEAQQKSAPGPRRRKKISGIYGDWIDGATIYMDTSPNR